MEFSIIIFYSMIFLYLICIIFALGMGCLALVCHCLHQEDGEEDDNFQLL